MNIILLENIPKLGQLGDQVIVKSGFGRNYLLPKRKAVLATTANIKKFEAQRAVLEKQQQETMAGAVVRAEKLNAITVSIARKAGSEGKLFGSVNAADIAKAVADMGIELDKQHIKLPTEEPIRQLGEFHCEAQLYTDVSATFKVDVVAE